MAARIITAGIYTTIFSPFILGGAIFIQQKYCGYGPETYVKLMEKNFDLNEPKPDGSIASPPTNRTVFPQITFF